MPDVIDAPGRYSRATPYVELTHRGHTAGGATIPWLRKMRNQRVRQVCASCQAEIGWDDVVVARDWSSDLSREP